MIGVCLYFGMRLVRTPNIQGELVEISKIAFHGDTTFEEVRKSAESGRVVESRYTDPDREPKTVEFRTRWIFRPSHALPFLPSPIVTDTDSDGKYEILFTDGENTLYGIWAEAGDVAWKWSAPFGQLTPGQNEIISILDDTGGAKRAVVVTSFVTRPFRVYVLDPRPGIRTNRYLWRANLAHEPVGGGISKTFLRAELTFVGLSVKVLEPTTNQVNTLWFDIHGRHKQKLDSFEISPADSQNERTALASEDLYHFGRGRDSGWRRLLYDDNEYVVLDEKGQVGIRIKRDSIENRLQNDLFLFHQPNSVFSIGHLSLIGNRLTLSEYGVQSRKLEHQYVTQLDMNRIASGFSAKWNLSHGEHIPERRGLVQVADIDGDHRWELLVQLDDALVAVDTPFELPLNQFPRVESPNSIYAMSHNNVVRSWIPYGSGSQLLVR